MALLFIEKWSLYKYMNNQYPIRVLQIVGMVCGGGVEAVIMNYYRNINRDKVQFDFVIDGNEKSLLDDEIKRLGGRVYHVTPYKENIIKYMCDIYRIMKNYSYEIVHDNMNTMAVFSLFPAWLVGAKIRILHNHSTNEKASDERFKYYLKKVLRPFSPLFANRYVACSQYAAEWMYGKSLIGLNKVKIINNAVDIDRFAFSKAARKRLREELGIREETNVIGHIGRLVPQKNHIFLLEVFAAYLRKKPDSVMVLIGDGPLREKLENKAKELGIANKVCFKGLRSDVNDWYSAMDIFLLPSLYEGLPVVGVEAQANGVPVCLSSNITKEVVINKNVSYLPLVKDAWIDSIDELIGKRSEQSLLKKEGFSIKYEAEKMGYWYEEMLKEV